MLPNVCIVSKESFSQQSDQHLPERKPDKLIFGFGVEVVERDLGLRFNLLITYFDELNLKSCLHVSHCDHTKDNLEILYL